MLKKSPLIYFLSISLSLSLSFSLAQSQSSLEIILSQVQENNTRLRYAQSRLDMEKLESRAGIYPKDPEVSYGYFPGSNPVIGDKEVIGISQELDFPLVYRTMSKMSSKYSGAAEQAYMKVRQDVLLEAKKEWNHMVYLNQRNEVLERRAQNAVLILSLAEKAADAGEKSELDVNKAKASYLNATSRLFLLEQQLAKSKQKLVELNGGEEIQLTDTSYSVEALPQMEDLLKEYLAEDPFLNNLRMREDLSQMNIRLKKQEWWPNLQIGYQVEKEMEGDFRGISAGISIPLWNDHKQVALAKSMHTSSINRLEDAELTTRSTLKSKYDRCIEIKQMLDTQIDMGFVETQERLLKKAFVSGELSQTELILELSYLYESVDIYQDLQYQYYNLLAELMAYKL